MALLLGARMLAAPSAQASVDNGTLTLGTPTSTDWETYVYRVTVPAAQRFALTSAASDTPTEGNLYVFDNAAGTRVGTGSFGSVADLAGRSIEVAPAVTARLLRVEFEVHGAGVLPFTPVTATDLPDRPITWGTPTNVTLDQPFRQATLTFSGIAGHRMGVAVNGSTFPAQGLTVTVEGPHPWTGVKQTHAPMPGARLRLEVLSSTLQHTDGTPGQATAYNVVRHSALTVLVHVTLEARQPLLPVLCRGEPEGDRRGQQAAEHRGDHGPGRPQRFQALDLA
ncbi:MAG: hypothetical protein WAL50_15515, partial [Kineosporiaceae bacterium]